MDISNDVLNGYVSALCEDIRGEYAIDPEQYKGHAIKKGLRNEDGTGVMAGVTRIGSVQGYYLEDGERIPRPGSLYYRGIDVNDLIEANVKNGTFGSYSCNASTIGCTASCTTSFTVLPSSK